MGLVWFSSHWGVDVGCGAWCGVADKGEAEDVREVLSAELINSFLSLREGMSPFAPEIPLLPWRTKVEREKVHPSK